MSFPKRTPVSVDPRTLPCLFFFLVSDTSFIDQFYCSIWHGQHAKVLHLFDVPGMQISCLDCTLQVILKAKIHPSKLSSFRVVGRIRVNMRVYILSKTTPYNEDCK